MRSAFPSSLITFLCPSAASGPAGHQVDLVAATGEEGDNGGRVYIEKLEEYATQRGATIETNAQVTALLTDDTGAVVGCEATRTDGSKITVNAKSVIITSGGYGADSDLVLSTATALSPPSSTAVLSPAPATVWAWLSRWAVP